MNDERERPLATYRLQMNSDFRFDAAAALVPYLSRLGVTHAYCSPILRARQESTHGYDVVDPATINPNLGDETSFRGFVTVLQNYGLGVILDIVPNHMAATIENPYWRDVLTYGPNSPFARWFDIDWRLPNPEMWGRVLVPILGQPLQRVLSQDEIAMIWSDGRFLVQYYDHTFPIDPATVPRICRFGFEELTARLETGHPAVTQLAEIFDRLESLPSLVVRARQNGFERDQVEQWLAQLAQIIVQSPQIHEWAEQTALRFGAGDEGRVRLRRLLDAQPYRLVYWREAARVINYRRFFDINALVSIRQEDPQVFDETHASIRRWIHDGLIEGLRIDHIDGLRDPLGYLERLVELIESENRRGTSLCLFVEKILAHDEHLPGDWPVDGTTGYDFLNQLEAVFLSPDGCTEIEHRYRQMLRRPVRFEEVAAWGKRRVLRDELSPHVGRLADILFRLSRQIVETSKVEIQSESAGSLMDINSESETRPRDHFDLTKRELIDAIVEFAVGLPIYRTYINHTGPVSTADERYIQQALEDARRDARATTEALDLLQRVLLPHADSEPLEHRFHERINFIERLQQLTGPAAAKGIEDTALYAYVPLVSRNEVGGEPNHPLEDSLTLLHQSNVDRAATRPREMLCVTTHDTKRTADVRARLDVLSELPKLWWRMLRKWRRDNRVHRRRAQGRLSPDTAAEYLFYQTILGIWPMPDPQQSGCLPDDATLDELQERLEQYMLKAAREAKIRTSWVKGNHEYEDALLAFVRDVLRHDDGEQNPFLHDVHHFVARIARPGMWNSLSRTLIQFTAPGTPDLYQGDELWNYALVDPDNRRPVDYELRQRLLNEVVTGAESPCEQRQAFLESLIEQPEDGRIKLHLICTTLHARRDHVSLFAMGDYVPLEVRGARAAHVVAFARVTPDRVAIVAAPRLTASLVEKPSDPPVGPSVWADTRIVLPEPLQRPIWTNILTHSRGQCADLGTMPLADVFQSLPVGLMISG